METGATGAAIRGSLCGDTRERESFHAKRIFHGDDLYLYRDVGYNLGPRFELTSSSPSRILLSLSLDATAIIPALVSDFGKH